MSFKKNHYNNLQCKKSCLSVLVYLSLDGSKDSKQQFLTIGPNYSPSSSSAFPFNGKKKKSLDTARSALLQVHERILKIVCVV